MKILTDEDALKYYEGDVTKTGDPLFDDAKAYITLNALFFEGSKNEEDKSVERKKLNPDFLSRIEEITGKDGVISHLFMAMKKQTPHPFFHTYRVERLSDFTAMCNENRTIAFTSTSDAGFLSAYGDKQKIVLLEFEIPEDIPCVNLCTALSFYRKAEESEILLPPFIQLSINEIPMDKAEQTIRDRLGNPPCGKYRVRCIAADSCEFRSLPYDPIACKDVYEAYNHGEIPGKNALNQYLCFKEAFRHKVKEQFKELFL